jgi:hypothetical protein
MIIIILSNSCKLSTLSHYSAEYRAGITEEENCKYAIVDSVLPLFEDETNIILEYFRSESRFKVIFILFN